MEPQLISNNLMTSINKWTAGHHKETFSPPSQQLCMYADDKEKFLQILILSRDPNGKCHSLIFPTSPESKGKKKKVNKTKAFRTKFALIWKWTLIKKEKQPEAILEMLRARKKIRRKTKPSKTSATEGCNILLQRCDKRHLLSHLRGCCYQNIQAWTIKMCLGTWVSFPAWFRNKISCSTNLWQKEVQHNPH